MYVTATISSDEEYDLIAILCVGDWLGGGDKVWRPHIVSL